MIEQSIARQVARGCVTLRNAEKVDKSVAANATNSTENQVLFSSTLAAIARQVAVSVYYT